MPMIVERRPDATRKQGQACAYVDDEVENVVQSATVCAVERYPAQVSAIRRGGLSSRGRRRFPVVLSTALIDGAAHRCNFSFPFGRTSRWNGRVGTSHREYE